MSHSFTIVPPGDFWAAANVVKSLARSPDIAETAEGPNVALHFAGSVDVRDELVPGSVASFRILPGATVFHVHVEGYEGSVVALSRFLVTLFGALPGSQVFDDETGEDLSWFAARTPSALCRAEAEYEEPRD